MRTPLQERLTSQLAAQGEANPEALADELLTKQGSLAAGRLTAKGEARQALGNEGRAKDRQAKYSGGKHGAADYSYDPATNRATLGRHGGSAKQFGL